MIHQFKKFVSDSSGTILYKGQTTLAPSASTVYLQIYNQLTNLWETIDSNNTTSAYTDFTLTANIEDFTNYKVGGVISCRIYQLAI